MKKKGFTLIELLVVITIIALLVSILMPALSKAKQQAFATVCSGNQKALIQAWMMYSTDNNDSLVQNYIDNSTAKYTGGSGGKGSWCEPPQAPGANGKPDYSVAPGTRCYQAGEGAGGNDLNSLSYDDAQLYRKAGCEAGLLYKYLKTTEVYHCPGDKKYSLGDDNMHQIYRTYTIALGAGPYDAEKAGEAQNMCYYNYDAHTKGTRMKTPQEKYIFVEDSYDCAYKNYSDRWLLRTNSSLASVDGMAGNYTLWSRVSTAGHKTSSTFAFADGHVEEYRWKSKDLMAWFNGETDVQATDEQAREDKAWLYRNNPGK